MQQQLITSQYEHKLAYIFHHIDKRGLWIDVNELDNIRVQCAEELRKLCADLSALWGFDVYVGREKSTKEAKALNINSSQKVLQRLKDLGYKVPKVRRKDQETHEYEFEESVDKLALQKLYADNTLWPDLPSGNAIKWLLDAKTIVTFRNRYVNARLYRGKYYASTNVAGTHTGRRSTKRSIFGFGGNNQNFPSRNRLSNLWKKCVIAGEGKVFLFVDQVSAEDWPVQALSENYLALEEMRSGVNRHYKFASAIFKRNISDLMCAREDDTHPLHAQCEMEYYFGKKGRHANNYGMQPIRMSESLAAEGYSYSPEACKYILTEVDRIDPNVKRVFHKYVQDCAYSSKMLRTPTFGRERQVFGLRSGEKNYVILNELYAYIPQSLIGDNTGLAINSIFESYQGKDNIVQESHDSICQELNDNTDALMRGFRATVKGFDRKIVFHNGIEVQIPIDGKIGYNWLETVKIKNFTEDGVLDAYKKLREKYPREEKGAKAAEEIVAGQLC